MRRWTIACALLVACAARAGAQAEKLLTPADVTELAYADCAALAPDQAGRTRYLWLPNLSAQDRSRWLAVLNGHVNGLSNQADLTPVRDVKGARGHLLAVVLDDYGWKKESWEKLAQTDPTFGALVVTRVEEYVTEYWPGGKDEHGKEWEKGNYRVKKVREKKVRTAAPWLVTRPAQKLAVEGLILLTGSQAPVANAFVFFDNTAAAGDGRSPSYYDMLNVKDEKGWLDLVGAEVARDAAFSTDLLAAVGLSGVTQEPRVIQRLDKRGGALWSSFDVLKGTARDDKNALRVVSSGADGKVKLNFDATEKVAHLPNRLMAYLLANNKGVLQDRAPDKVAQDSQEILRNEHSVLINVSCVRCHSDGGLKDVNDWWRNFPPELNPIFGDRQGKQFDYEDYRRLRRQYVRKLEPYLAQDRERYRAALKEVTGLTPQEYATRYALCWDEAANATATLDYASRQLGVPAEQFQRAVAHQVRLGKADPVLAQYVKPERSRQGIPLGAWREVYALAQQYLVEAPR